MSYAFLILFFFILMYAYILYPTRLKKQASGKILQFAAHSVQDNLPAVNIVIPVCNEEKVIEAKLNSIFAMRLSK